jgi:GT2 family glycosyltransferase
VGEITAPILSVVLTTYSRRDLLAECLDSARQAVGSLSERVEVLVVDDGRQSGIAELLESRFPAASLLTTPGNTGFAAAAMEGIRQTRGEWIALLNDDVTVERDTFAWMLQAARSAPDIGSVATQMRFADRPGMINSAGIEIDALVTPCDRLVGAPIEASEAEIVEVFGASGGAALYRRAMLNEVGGFDVSFFAYLDDVDLAWRARMFGWRCLYAPRAVVYHRHSATFGHHSALKHFLTGRNRVRLVAKNADAAHLRRYGPAMALYDLAYVVFVGVRERTLQPARGRLRGLREWQTYRAAGRTYRRAVPLAGRRLLRSALARDRAWPRGTAD